MIKLLNHKSDPLHIEIFNDFNENVKALFLWEDNITKITYHTELVDMASKIGYYSALNKSIDFFKNDVCFKVVKLDDYQVLFTHLFKNFKFIYGKNILYISQNNYSGYSYSARNYIFQLLKNNFNVHWINNILDKSIYKPCNEEEELVFNCENKYDPTIFYDSVIIHNVPNGWGNLDSYFNRAKKVYGLTTWETTHLHNGS